MLSQSLLESLSHFIWAWCLSNQIYLHSRPSILCSLSKRQIAYSQFVAIKRATLRNLSGGSQAPTGALGCISLSGLPPKPFVPYYFWEWTWCCYLLATSELLLPTMSFSGTLTGTFVKKKKKNTIEALLDCCYMLLMPTTIDITRYLCQGPWSEGHSRSW